MDQDTGDGQPRPASTSVVTVEREQGAQPYASENDPVLRLLREWLADDSGYDEEVWPELDQALKRSRLHLGERARSGG
jgi:hypothetical protein